MKFIENVRIRTRMMWLAGVSILSLLAVGAIYLEDESLMAVPLRTGSRLEVGKAKRILTVPGKSFLFDIHPDGRFLLALSDGTAQRSHEVRLVRDVFTRANR